MLKRPSAFTVVELLIVLAIVGGLLAILLPVFFQVRSKSRTTTCSNNIQQCLLTLRMYVQDNDGYWPNEKVWGKWRKVYGNLQHCPEVALPEASLLQQLGHIPGYAYSSAFVQYGTNPIHDADIPFPATTIALGEATALEPVIASPNPYQYLENQPPGIFEDWKRHQGGANYAFCDGHVKVLKPDGIGGNCTPVPDGTFPSFCIAANRN